MIARNPGDVAAYLESAEADVRRVAVVALGRAGRRPDLARLADRLLDDEGGLRRFVNLYVADDDVRFRDGLDTEVADGDTVSIIPAVAGG